MNEKNDVQVIINGKQYTLCGYESSDYLQHIANHINEKFSEFKKQEDYNRLDFDMRNILLAINLSDDFFKAQRLADDLKQQQEELEQEIFDMKHELMKRDEELTGLKEQLEELREQNTETERQNIRLETELEQKNQELQKRAVPPVSAGRQAAPVPQSVRTGRPALNQTAQPGAPIAQPVMRQQGSVPGKPQVAVSSQVAAVPSPTSAAPMPAAVVQSVTSAAPTSAVVPETAAAESAKTASRSAASASRSAEPAAVASASEVQQENTEQPVMTGIQPAPTAPGKEAKSSIAAFELEKSPEETAGAENGDAAGNKSPKTKGRKNSGTKRSQNKRK